MNSFNIEKLFKTIQFLLKNYDCYDVYFLDNKRKWNKNPEKLKDIISSEVWFRIWASSRYYDNDELLDLFKPIVNNVHFQGLMSKFTNNADGMEIDITDTLITFEILYDLIEYHIHILNTEKYIPDWNYQGKKIQNEYLCRVDDFKKNLKSLLSDQVLFDSFFQIYKALTKNNLFNSISTTINEEIKLYEEQILLKRKLEESKKINQIYDFLSNKIDFDIGSSVTQKQALIRPFLRLLNDAINPAPIGLQFEIVSILGALKDPRCAKTLLNLLKNTSLEYTNLISNIIYALGNLQYSEISDYLKMILQLPDYIDLSSGYKQPIYDVKSEAIWSTGKLGITGRNLINEIVKYISHKDNTIKIALAWTMGMIGTKEKKEEGVVDLEILTTLLELLKDKNKKVFEESIYSLKVLGFYELIDNLNLNNIPATPILALKPSSIGLYELSETLYHLISLKQPVVIAVTGDSGTGKTYFCESIKYGFGDISKDDILYLMRDNPAHRTIFSRMIDKKFTKDFLDPQYYTIETMDEKKLASSQVFFDFINQYSHKKLIILDGWLDEIYFYQVLKIFYQFNYLDCVINFRTTYSTRRINLETREGILERVRDCLRFVENPPIEETEFYRNGDVYVYNLDNSINSRLSADEIKEVFSRKKVRLWAEHIRIGSFAKKLKELEIKEKPLNVRTEDFIMQNDCKIETEDEAIEIHTERFFRSINNDIVGEPNLLQKIRFKKFIPEKISHYSPGIIAYHNTDGIVGILTGINDQNHFTQIRKDKIYNHCIFNDQIFAIGNESKIYLFDFNKNLLRTLKISAPPLSAIATDRNNIIATGHQDGTIRIWDINSKITHLLKGHKNPIIDIVIDKKGIIVSNSIDGELRLWNLYNNSIKIYNDMMFNTSLMGLERTSDNIIFVKENNVIKLDQENETIKIVSLPNDLEPIAFYPYYDGRIFAGYRKKEDRIYFIVIEFKKDKGFYNTIRTDMNRITGITAMGPRIIISGMDTDGAIIEILGSETYVRGEFEKLQILKNSKRHFQYHSMIF
uniref:Uncharacterized protein n=1 Tax=candidate division WOR-3 bacterium TaxID=2052148 RepID=A0A7V0Z6B5_UNCW3